MTKTVMPTVIFGDTPAWTLTDIENLKHMLGVEAVVWWPGSGPLEAMNWLYLTDSVPDDWPIDLVPHHKFPVSMLGNFKPGRTIDQSIHAAYLAMDGDEEEARKDLLTDRVFRGVIIALVILGASLILVACKTVPAAPVYTPCPTCIGPYDVRLSSHREALFGKNNYD